jgi:hypothetical protein
LGTDAIVEAAPRSPDQQSDDARRFDELVAEGMEHLEHGRFAEAATAFETAHEIVSDPNLLFQIAQAWDRGASPTRAVLFYREFLANSSEDHPHHPQARARLEALTAEASKPRPPPSGRRLALWTSIGVAALGGILVATGAWYGHEASSIEQEIEALPPGTPWDDDLAARDREAGRFSRRAGYLLVIGSATTVVGATVATYLYLRDRRRTRMDVALGAGGVGVSVMGRF